MAMGDYDATEHERRERKSNDIDAPFDDGRTTYEGEVEYEGGESTEELLDQFDRIKSD
jgi:hypothetical protein